MIPHDAQGVLYLLRQNFWKEIHFSSEAKMVSDIEMFENDLLLATNPYYLYYFDGKDFQKHKLQATPYKIWGLSLNKFWMTVHPMTWLESGLYKCESFKIIKQKTKKIPGLSGLSGIHGIDNNNIWAVGPLRSIYHFENGRWQLEEFDGNFGKFQFLSRDNYLLYDVYALNRYKAYAVGSKGALLEYIGR